MSDNIDMSWLSCNEVQIIRFRDRIEHRKNREKHDLLGPAVVWFDGIEEYYIEGVFYDKESWLKESKIRNRGKKLNLIINSSEGKV